MFWALAKELPEMHVPTSNMQYCQCALFVNQLFHAKIQFVLVQRISISGPQTDSHSHLQPINLMHVFGLLGKPQDPERTHTDMGENMHTEGIQI